MKGTGRSGSRRSAPPTTSLPGVEIVLFPTILDTETSPFIHREHDDIVPLILDTFTQRVRSNTSPFSETAQGEVREAKRSPRQPALVRVEGVILEGGSRQISTPFASVSSSTPSPCPKLSSLSRCTAPLLPRSRRDGFTKRVRSVVSDAMVPVIIGEAASMAAPRDALSGSVALRS